MTSASVRRNRARGYWVAPMEAGMEMRCRILLISVIVEPVEGKVSFWDHQTPSWNHLWGSNGVRLCVLGVLGTRERRKRGHARQFDFAFRRHLDGFRCFMVNLNHNKVHICVV